MYKFTQKQILEEELWDSIKKPLKQGWEATKQISSVVAPEIHDPIKKFTDWKGNFQKNVKRAGMTKDEIVIEQIIESGFYPYTDTKGVESTVKWGKKNTDGTITGSIKVGELGYRDNGEPYMAAEFNNVLKSDVIFKYNPDTKDIKIVRAPYRNASVHAPTQNPPPTP